MLLLGGTLAPAALVSSVSQQRDLISSRCLIRDGADARERREIMSVNPNAYYWHYRCPKATCTMPVRRVDVPAFNEDEAEALKTTDGPTLRCELCGAPMTGYLQKPKFSLYV